jgi:hypothetical protein
MTFRNWILLCSSALAWLATPIRADADAAALNWFAFTSTPHGENWTVCSSGGRGTLSLGVSASPPAGGAKVTLNSSDPSLLTVPQSVVPTVGGLTDIPVTTTSADVAGSVQLTAMYQGKSMSIDLEVVPASSPFSLALDAYQVRSGTSVNAKLNMHCPAPKGGSIVRLATYDPSNVLSFPPTVTVPEGQSSATFQIGTKPVTSWQDFQIYACDSVWPDARTCPYVRKALQDLTVYPSAAAPPPPVADFTISPSTVNAGQSATVRVTLGSKAPPGLFVYVSSSDHAFPPPLAIAVATAASSGEAVHGTCNVTTPTTVKLTASSGGGSLTQTILINPVPSLKELDVPSQIPVGGVATGTITLDAPAPSAGIEVALVSNDPSIATVPAKAILRSGQTSAQFAIAGNAQGWANISAVHACLQYSTDVAVGSPPARGGLVGRALPPKGGHSGVTRQRVPPTPSTSPTSKSSTSPTPSTSSTSSKSLTPPPLPPIRR